MINLGWAPCLDCENVEFVKKTTASIVFMHLRTASHLLEIPLQFVATFRQWNDSHTKFKRHYLLNVLLARDSVFRQFTFFYNKKRGNLSAREDVIDRIVCFVA